MAEDIFFWGKTELLIDLAIQIQIASTIRNLFVHSWNNPKEIFTFVFWLVFLCSVLFGQVSKKNVRELAATQLSSIDFLLRSTLVGIFVATAISTFSINTTLIAFCSIHPFLYLLFPIFPTLNDHLSSFNLSVFHFSFVS